MQCVQGTNLTGIDPDTGATVRLFHPRKDLREEHFSCMGGRIVERTPTGRATVWLLQMNSPDRLELRVALQAAGDL